ncbi:MAG: VWA domain-containing protein [Candidatus Obscuribacterales bacterium]|nr:VWA domain-containing protein [Candidatus Obscuribacterales bacterium]
MNKKRQLRNCRGQSLVVLGAFLALFVVGVLGMFAFDAGRVEIAREQLMGACDAAALSSVCTLAGSDIANASDAHTHAINLAMNSFQQNYVMGKLLSNATQGAKNANPGPDEAVVNIEILDPHNNYQPVSAGDPRGKVVRVYGSYGVVPVFAKFLGVDKVVVHANSSGGIPQLDLILCFDVSASMDDQTKVTFVKRQFDPGANKIAYTITSTNGSPVGPTAEGPIAAIVGAQPSGTALNGLSPQNLECADYTTSHPLNFSESTDAKGLRGATNTGSPPGNYPGPSASGVGGAFTFTDVVVNLDGNVKFQGFSKDGYDFPDVATLVEAARGNLENEAVFQSSKAKQSLPYLTPRPGYQAKYLECARPQQQPIEDGRYAAQYFLNIMNINTDAHFGVVSFSNEAGPTKLPGFNVSPKYNAGGTCEVVIPTVELSRNQNNFTNVMSAVGSVEAYGSTNIGDAVNTAVQHLKAQNRPTSKQVIVLFTDGMPTQGGPLSNDPFTNARQAAVKAHDAGIPVFTLGLAQNQEIIPYETAILNDTNDDPGSGGIAAISGNGARFYLVTDSSKLRATFENIARQLVQLIDTGVEE